MSEKKMSKQELIEVNGLDYSMSRSLSQVVSTNYSVERFHTGLPLKNGSGSISRILNTGESYVDSENSYLVMSMKFGDDGAPAPGYVANTAYPSFGAGSVINCIQEITIKSKDGKLVDKIERFNLLGNILVDYHASRDWKKTNGSTTGETFEDAEGGVMTAETIGTFLCTGQGFDFAVPLSSLGGLWDTGKLLPSQLMAGLHFEIKFNTKQDAFKNIGAFDVDAVDWNIKDVYLRLRTVQLSDMVLAQLSDISSKSGLKIIYEGYHHSRDSAKGNVTTNIRSNLAQVKQIITKHRDQDSENNKAKDSNASESNISAYYWRYGSQNVPQDEVKSGTEQYRMAISAFERNEAEKSAGVTYNEWFSQGKVISHSFCRDCNLSLSGVSISNAKTLSLMATFSDDADKHVDSWVKHDKLLTVFLSNVTVES